jgi:hypothetical protein
MDRTDPDCSCEVVHFRDLFPDGESGKGYKLQGLLEDGYEWQTETSLKKQCLACWERERSERPKDERGCCTLCSPDGCRGDYKCCNHD